MLQFKFKFKLKKSVDGVLGIQTWGGRMEGANESTELWRNPKLLLLHLATIQVDRLEILKIATLIAAT